MDIVYVETTVVGNTAGRLHPNPIIRVRQELTRRWWASASNSYRLVTSQITVDECSDGDPDAAAERLEVLRDIELLDVTDDARLLTKSLIDQLAVPASQPRDALHIAIGAVHRVQFILTWNFKHILNPHMQNRIADTCRFQGYTPPVICTLEQLMESDDDSWPD
jgi:hypothetical protein